MQHVTKSRTTSAVHAEIGDWKVNPSRRLEVMPITRHARHALREGPGTRNGYYGLQSYRAGPLYYPKFPRLCVLLDVNPQSVCDREPRVPYHIILRGALK